MYGKYATSECLEVFGDDTPLFARTDTIDHNIITFGEMCAFMVYVTERVCLVIITSPCYNSWLKTHGKLFLFLL